MPLFFTMPPALRYNAQPPAVGSFPRFSFPMKPSPFGAILLLALVPVLPLRAQLAVRARFEGGYFPVVGVGRQQLTVLRHHHHESTGSLDYAVQPDDAFAGGFVRIEHVHADLDPLRHASAAERANPNAVRFRYAADLVARTSLSDCYALLTFVSEGSVGTHLAWLGHLRAGAPAHVTFALATAVDSVGTLHVLRAGREIRTNEHPAAYDAKAYYAALLRHVTALSAADLVRADRYFPHVLSDDGRDLATIRDHDGRQMLIAYDLATMKLRCETRIADEDAYAADLTWVSDHEIAYVAEDDVKLYPGRIGLHLLDTRTGRTQMLAPHVRAIIGRVAGHPDVLVVIERRNGDTCFKYNVHTRKVFGFEDPSSGQYWFDSDGVARLRLRSQGDDQTYAARPTATSSWRDLDDIARPSGLRFDTTAPHLLDRTVEPITMGGNPDVLYVATRRASDTYAIARFSLSRGVIEQTIAKLPTYDLGPDASTTLLFGGLPNRHLIGMYYHDERPEVAWLDPRLAADQRAIDAACPGHANLPLSVARNGSVLVFWSTSDRDPGTYYAYRPANRELIPLLALGRRLVGKTLAPTTPFWFQARDGARIPAYVTLPAHAGTRPPPLVVRIHSGPFARAVWRFDPLNQFLASRGFAVLQVNYRGSSGYGARFQKAGLEARLDTVMIDDVADGVRHLIRAGKVDGHRITVYGNGGFAGWAAYISLARYPELYGAGIAIRGTTDWRRRLRDPEWRKDTFWRALLERPDNADHQEAIEPILRAAAIKQPVLIIDRQDSTDAREMVTALQKAGGNVQAWSYRQLSFSTEVELMNQIAGFLEQDRGTVQQPSGPTGSG